jgi:hypothetical protein
MAEKRSSWTIETTARPVWWWSPTSDQLLKGAVAVAGNLDGRFVELAFEGLAAIAVEWVLPLIKNTSKKPLGAHST